jgi:translation initiation factor IF-2
LPKNIKLNIKNSQIAKALNLDSVKNKLAKKQAEESPESVAKPLPAPKPVKAPIKKEKPKEVVVPEQKEEAALPPRVRARSKSVFAPPPKESFSEDVIQEEPQISPQILEETTEPEAVTSKQTKPTEIEEPQETTIPSAPADIESETIAQPKEPEIVVQKETPQAPSTPLIKKPAVPSSPVAPSSYRTPAPPAPPSIAPRGEKLGPTGRHVKDLYTPPPRPVPPRAEAPRYPSSTAPRQQGPGFNIPPSPDKAKLRSRWDEGTTPSSTPPAGDEGEEKKKAAKFKEFRDIKPAKKTEPTRSFDARDRHGLRGGEEEGQWRKRRAAKHRPMQEDTTIRPTSLKIRVPIMIKDLASEMKLKASQLVAKLFLQGVVTTLNDFLEDEITIQLLGHEFGCEIAIDTSEEERIRITGKSIREEITGTEPSKLHTRAPIVTFMGHVDHGKTSLIDAIRKSNRTAGEAGAITQHIGAFRCKTAVGDITVLDTPGHEAFSAMRARGADVTDIVVLVVAGDEGLRQQTIEAIQHAKAANVIIVVAINKSDKPNFNPENVYRQLSEQELLPEAWGGQTITINCSATTGEGVPQLLEMLALQAEVLELRADPSARARGTVLESEMHKGLGAVATVLIQNGTLHPGDALVFGHQWGHVKTMQDEFGVELTQASPSTPVAITGVSGLPQAGEEFVVVKNEREARDIAEKRVEVVRQSNLLLKKKASMESILQQASDGSQKKILNIVLRADVQGSLEALKIALLKIESAKVDLNIIFAGVGEISESDIQLSLASKAVILGFHTQVESHADQLAKQYGVQVRLHDIIYHAIDDVKVLMAGLLDRIPQENDRGKAEVKATFKASQVGIIAGCQVVEGTIHRNHQMRVRRGNEIVWKGGISSLKRVKEDVREVSKGVECGIVLNGYNEVKEGDILESYEITYLTQEL